MIWKLQYSIMVGCLMVTSVISATEDASNSTLQSQDEASLQQENPQESRTIPSEIFMKCSPVDLNIYKLFACQSTEYFQNLALKLQTQENVLRYTKFWMKCWMESCWEIFNKLKSLTYPQVLGKTDIDRDAFVRLIPIYDEALKMTLRYKADMKLVTDFYEKFLTSQYKTLKEISNGTQLINYTEQFNCQYLSPACTDDLNRKHVDFVNTLSQLNILYNLRIYVHPAIMLLIWCTGLFWNGTLILMFVRNRELRIIPNTMLINIAAIDMLQLVVGLPYNFYVLDYSYPALDFVYRQCNVSIQMTLSFVRASSLLAMSIQRYLAISKSLATPSSAVPNNPRFYVTVCILAVWLSSAGAVALILSTSKFALFYHDTQTVNFIMYYGNMIVYVSMTVGVTIFNVLTAYYLKRSAKDIPGENAQKLLRSRYRSSNTIIALTVVFWITHGLYMFTDQISMLIQIQHLDYFRCAMYYLYFSNTFLNPLALFITSRKFRILFKKYICRCCYAMTRLRRVDSQHLN